VYPTIQNTTGIIKIDIDNMKAVVLPEDMYTNLVKPIRKITEIVETTTPLGIEKTNDSIKNITTIISRTILARSNFKDVIFSLF
jgi:hypothetical protein